MSVRFTSFIPLDPRFVPAPEAAAAALAILRAAVPEAQDLSSESDEHIVFHDCGEDLDAVRCPGCGAGIAIGTWYEWLNADYDGAGFRLEPLNMPCCGARRTLDDLTYEAPQGFSRYALSARDVWGELPESLLSELEKALGCRLRTILQHL
jgi:hypothetical protein